MNNNSLASLLLAVSTLIGVATAVYNYIQARDLRKRLEGFQSYQHRAMWEEYATNHGIPVNGKG